MCLVGRNRPQQQSGRYAAASGRRRRDIQNSSSRAPKAATATTKIAVQNGGLVRFGGDAFWALSAPSGGQR